MSNQAKRQTDIADKLKARFGTDITSFPRLKCRTVGQTLRIPLFDFDGKIFTERVKNFADTGPKYWWSEGAKPTHELSDWYILPGTKAAIGLANGVCYLTNGEPATLTLSVAQVYNNFCTTLSEISVPKNILEVMAHLGVTEFRYLIDKDKTGLKAAINWRDALLGSGITFKAYHMPDHLPDKSDVNDLWIYHKFNVESFQKALSELERAILPQLEVKRPPNVDFEFDSQGLVAAIQDALQISGAFTGTAFKNKNWLQIKCIYHDEKNASAGFDPQTGVINCFHCGAKSPKESAEVLGINWRAFLPDKPNPRKKPQNRIIPIEEVYNPQSRSYEQVIDDDIMARQLAYESGNYVSWFSGNELPIAVLSAVMVLADGRSSMPLVFGKMHHALKTGKLKSYFTINDIIEATSVRRGTIVKALETLIQWGFVHFLKTQYLYIDSNKDKVSQESVHKSGKPSQVFAIEMDSDVLRVCLLHMLEVHYQEKYFRRAIAPRNEFMALQLGLIDDSDWRQFKARGKAAQSDKDNKAAQRSYQKEIRGDGYNWRGWELALKTDLTVPIDWDEVKSCKDLRGQILTWWVLNIRNINSRDELQRLLGCSDPIIDSVMAGSNLTSDLQSDDYKTEEIPSSVKGMRILFNKIQREKRGHCWSIKFKIKAKQDKDGKWEKSYTISAMDYSYLRVFASHVGEIDYIFFLLSTPSKQRPMTADEIKDRDWENAIQEGKNHGERVAETERDDLVIENSRTTESVSDEPQVELTEPRIKSEKDRFTYHHLFNQIRLEVHCFTDYKLLPDCTLMGSDNEIVRSRGELLSIIKYLNDIASEKPLRTVKSFYGDDYDEDADIAALELIVQERLARLEPQAMPVEELPKQMALEAAPKVLHDDPLVAELIGLGGVLRIVEKKKRLTLAEVRGLNYQQSSKFRYMRNIGKNSA